MKKHEIKSYAICPECKRKYYAPFGDAFHCHAIHQGCPNCGCRCIQTMFSDEVKKYERSIGKCPPWWEVKRFKHIFPHWRKTGKKWFFGLFNVWEYVDDKYIVLE